MIYLKTYLCLSSLEWCQFHLQMQYWASCQRAGRQRTWTGIFLQLSKTWTLINQVDGQNFFHCLNTTCVRRLSNICITEPSSLQQAGIHFIISSHWNIYRTGQKHKKWMIPHILKIIKSPPRQKGNLHLLKSVSHSVGNIFEQFECIPYCQPCEENHAPAWPVI